MATSDKKTSNKPDELLLCGGGCQNCPTATFAEDGNVTLSEFGEKVTLTPFQLGMLVTEAIRRNNGSPK